MPAQQKVTKNSSMSHFFLCPGSCLNVIHVLWPLSKTATPPCGTLVPTYQGPSIPTPSSHVGAELPSSLTTLSSSGSFLIGSLADILSSRQQQPKTKKAGPSLSLWCNRSNPHHPLPLRLHKQHPSAHHWQWRWSRWLDGRAALAREWQPERLRVTAQPHEGRRGRTCRGWAWPRLRQQRNQGQPDGGGSGTSRQRARHSEGQAKVNVVIA
jgi:hypothetical protein